MQHTAQLSCLRSRLRRHAGEHDLLSVIIADLGKENLECASLVLTSRPHMAAVNGERNRVQGIRIWNCLDTGLGACPIRR